MKRRKFLALCAMLSIAAVNLSACNEEQARAPKKVMDKMGGELGKPLTPPPPPPGKK